MSSIKFQQMVKKFENKEVKKGWKNVEGVELCYSILENLAFWFFKFNFCFILNLKGWKYDTLICALFDFITLEIIFLLHALIWKKMHYF